MLFYCPILLSQRDSRRGLVTTLWRSGRSFSMVLPGVLSQCPRLTRSRQVSPGLFTPASLYELLSG